MLAPNTAALKARRQKSKAVAFELLFCAGDVHTRAGVSKAGTQAGVEREGVISPPPMDRLLTFDWQRG